MAIEKKSLISSTPAAKSTASRLATTKKVNDKMNAGKAVVASALLTAGGGINRGLRATKAATKLVPAKKGGGISG
jgi:hypothetical protein